MDLRDHGDASRAAWSVTSQSRRMAAMAEAHGVLLAPHCPLAFAACLQVDFATPDAIIQETSLGIRSPTWRNQDGSLAEW